MQYNINFLPMGNDVETVALLSQRKTDLIEQLEAVSGGGCVISVAIIIGNNKRIFVYSLNQIINYLNL